MASRDEILATRGKRTTVVQVPEWPCQTVSVRIITALDKLKMHEGNVASGNDPKLAVARLVSYGVADDQGNRLFTDEDIPALAELDGDVVERIATAFLEFNGMGAAVEKSASAEKNS